MKSQKKKRMERIGTFFSNHRPGTFAPVSTPQLGREFELLNITKGTTDPRVDFISQVLTQILIKFQFQN